MENLGVRFIEEMGLSEQSNLVKTVACECLFLTVENQYIKGDKDEVIKTCFPPEIIENDKMLVQILDIAGYWSNDLAFILQKHLIDNKVVTPLLDDKHDPFSPIHTWLQNNGYSYESQI